MSLRAANRLKHISISSAGAGSTDLIAAPSGSTVGQKIRVTSYVLVSSTATATVQWNSGTGPTARSGVMSLAAGVPLAVQGTQDAPVLEAASNEKLTLTQAGAGQVSGHLTYEVVPATP
jgi:hypothetical protein